jgi:hypothetical protein
LRVRAGDRMGCKDNHVPILHAMVAAICLPAFKPKLTYHDWGVVSTG